MGLKEYQDKRDFRKTPEPEGRGDASPSGRLYVIQNAEHETTFKKFSARPLQLLPCSHNPSHTPIDLGSEPFTVIGRVVFIGFEP